MIAFKGSKSCGCLVWLYSGEIDTPKQREKAIAQALKDGLHVEPIRTEREKKEASAAWRSCAHENNVTPKEAHAKAREILAASQGGETT